MEYELQTIREFLIESNKIERENTQEAHADAFEAWTYLITQNRLDIVNIHEVHRILMCRLNPSIAGNFRKVNVKVGAWDAPNPGSIQRRIFQWLNEPKTKKDIKQAHIDFEKIHPFEDGNGRIGRIIMNWQRVKADLPILIIHTGREQQEYYEWFKD